MGKLALFGALAGAGQAVAADGARRQKLADEAAAGSVAEQREIRIQKLRAELEGGLQKERIVAEDARSAADRESRKTLSREEQQAQTDREILGNESREKEGAANRQNAVEVAKIQADARAASASSKNDRFFIQTQQRTKPAPLGADGKPTGALGEEYEATVVTDKETGQTFEQFGDKFVPKGVDLEQFTSKPGYRPPSPSAVQKLLSKAVSPEEFYQQFGYLPAQYLGK